MKNQNLISVEECISSLIKNSKSLVETETIELLSARNRVLATDIKSSINVPPADNSAMDGYAINIKDYVPGESFKVSQRIQAGNRYSKLEEKTAARIFTGAEIPKGADTVIIQENTQELFGLITVNSIPACGDNIRKRGQDIAKGQQIIEKGSRLRPQELGLLASVGINSIEVYKPLKVGILNTGNELVEPGKHLTAGKIYNSNRYLVDSILSDWGFETIHAKAAKDTLVETKKKLSELAEKCDIILTTGGVSVGEEDHVKNAVASLGDLELSKVKIKPGKPFAFGQVKETPFIGLPGNPSSTFVTLLMLARPFLLASQGRRAADLPANPVKIKANIMRHLVSREEYIRCRLSENGLEIYPNQSSGVLSSASWGNCLLRHPTGVDISPKTMLDVFMYRELLY